MFHHQSGDIELKMFSFGYSLELGNGLCWTFYFSPDLRIWGQKFMSILGLPASTAPQGWGIYLCSEREARSPEIIGFFNEAENACKNQLDHFTIRGVNIFYNSDTHDSLSILPLVTVKRDEHEIIHMMIILFIIYYQLLQHGGLPLHGALLSHPGYGGIGILAPGGTGKSTCARRIPAPWSSYCDDLFWVVSDGGSQYFAHPFPTWSEYLDENKRQPGLKRWNVRNYTHLKDLYFLQKAEDDDSFTLNLPDASLWIFESSMQTCLWLLDDLPKEEQRQIKIRMFENSCILARNIPARILKATLNGQFWKIIEKIGK